MSVEEESKLSAKEKFELAIQAGLQLIPSGIGGAISNIDFGLKQEKRFKRIELFFREIALKIKNVEDAQVNEMKIRLQSIDLMDKERLAFIIEELFEKV